MIRIKEYYCDRQGPPSIPEACTAKTEQEVHNPYYWALRGTKISELVPAEGPPDQYGGIVMGRGRFQRLLCRCGGTVRRRDAN